MDISRAGGGGYLCTAVPSVPGTYLITPMLNGNERIAGAPVRVEVSHDLTQTHKVRSQVRVRVQA